MPLMTRRRLLAMGAATLVTPILPAFAATPAFFHNEGCGCCHEWARHMAAAGLGISLQSTPDLSGEYARHGVPARFETCHVGRIDGYVISGHVPPADIRRLLADRPEAAGLLVPAMPVGSPGMEYGDQVEPYSVLLLKADGSVSVFAKHG